MHAIPPGGHRLLFVVLLFYIFIVCLAKILVLRSRTDRADAFADARTSGPSPITPLPPMIPIEIMDEQHIVPTEVYRSQSSSRTMMKGQGKKTLTNLLPAINQTGSTCGVNAVCNAVGYLLANKGFSLRGAGEPPLPRNMALPSRTFVCWLCNFLDGKDIYINGTSVKRTIELILTYGCVNEQLMPNSWGMFGNATVPSPQCFAMASKRRFVVNPIGIPDGILGVRNAIDDGNPVPISLDFSCADGFHVFKRDAEGDMIIAMPPDGKACWYHAMMIVGYDDDRRRFLVENCWGILWGDNGCCYMSYDVYTAVVGTRACVIPELIAYVPPTPAAGGSSDVTVTPGNPTSIAYGRNGYSVDAQVILDSPSSACPYNDFHVWVLNVDKRVAGSVQLLFDATPQGFTVNVSAYIGPHMSLTVVSDGTSTAVSGDKDGCAAQTMQLKQLHSVRITFS